METRAIDVATALLVATSALCCSVAVGCAFLLAAGAAAPTEDELGAWCAAAALACASVAALIALTRAAGGLRRSALALAWALAFAWPLSGSVVPAALIATLGTGLAVVWGADGARGRDGTRAAAWFAAAALLLIAAAFAAAAPDDGAAYRPPAEARITAAPDAPSPTTPDAPSPTTPDAPSPTTPDAVPPVTGRDISPARTVRGYYRALDRADFDRAWRSLSPAVRASFGGFGRWSAGFAATIASVPSELHVTTAGGEATVAHVLTARDRTDCGVLVRRFSVQWHLRRAADSWRATALTAQPLGAAQPCQ